MPTADDHAHHGLAHDVSVLTRRRWLGLAAKAAGLSLIPALAGCQGDPADEDICARIPEETAGPFPGDGTNGANALALSGIVRSDIRTSIAGATGVADGVVLTLALTLVDSATCAPLSAHAVYLWQCDRDGNYSMYSPAAAGENYLRGVQVTDGAGQVTFTTIFPGCYPGRWPHIHFEIFATPAPTSGSGTLAISQLALPKAACDGVYASAGYGTSASALGQLSLASDGVFRDGAEGQIPTVTGTVASGYTAALTIAVAS